MWGFIKTLIDADKIGGWARALVAATVGALALKFPMLGQIFSPEVTAALQVIAVAAAVGIWSQIAKSKA